MQTHPLAPDRNLPQAGQTILDRLRATGTRTVFDRRQKKGSLAAGILHHLVDEIGHRAPLDIAGILKFIEQPVVERAIESVSDQSIRAVTTKQHALNRCQQHRQIAKHQPTGPANPEVVLFFECIQQPVNPLRAGKPQLSSQAMQYAEHVPVCGQTRLRVESYSWCS